jgi:hypothetical protein
MKKIIFTAASPGRFKGGKYKTVACVKPRLHCIIVYNPDGKEKGVNAIIYDKKN